MHGGQLQNISGPLPQLTMPRRATSRTKSPHRRKQKPWISVNSFLAVERSRGPHEAARGEAMTYAAVDLDINALLWILRSNDRGALRRITCIPNFRLCIYEHTDSYEVIMRHTTGNRCPSAPRGFTLIADIRAGALVTNLLNPRKARLYLPNRLDQSLIECEGLGKRFCVCNFGLYTTSDVQGGHSSGLIFDLQSRVIERYEPQRRDHISSQFDRLIKRLFIKQLPEWEYTGIIGGAQTPATDSYHGMCVTFAFQYVLLRLLNPDRTPHEISDFMLRGSASGRKERVLHLNRWMLDLLRRH